jgi:hypothetical protein
MLGSVGLITNFSDNLNMCRTEGIGGGCTNVRSDGAAPSASLVRRKMSQLTLKPPVRKVDIATNVQSRLLPELLRYDRRQYSDYSICCTIQVSNLGRGKNLSSKTPRPTVRPSQPSIQRIPSFFSGDGAAGA